MKNLLKIVAIAVVLVIGYNLYFGTPQEKENAQEFVDQVKNLGKSTWNLLKSEKEKLDDGKYDQALDNVKGLFEKIKGVARNNSNNDQISEIDQLERKRQELQRRLEQLNRPSDYSANPIAPQDKSREEAEIKEELRKLLESTEQLMKRMEE